MEINLFRFLLLELFLFTEHLIFFAKDFDFGFGLLVSADTTCFIFLGFFDLVIVTLGSAPQVHSTRLIAEILWPLKMFALAGGQCPSLIKACRCRHCLKSSKFVKTSVKSPINSGLKKMQIKNTHTPPPSSDFLSYFGHLWWILPNK